MAPEWGGSCGCHAFVVRFGSLECQGKSKHYAIVLNPPPIHTQKMLPRKQPCERKFIPKLTVGDLTVTCRANLPGEPEGDGSTGPTGPEGPMGMDGDTGPSGSVFTEELLVGAGGATSLSSIMEFPDGPQEVKTMSGFNTPDRNVGFTVTGGETFTPNVSGRYLASWTFGASHLGTINEMKVVVGFREAGTTNLLEATAVQDTLPGVAGVAQHTSMSWSGVMDLTAGTGIQLAVTATPGTNSPNVLDFFAGLPLVPASPPDGRGRWAVVCFVRIS